MSGLSSLLILVLSHMTPICSGAVREKTRPYHVSQAWRIIKNACDFNELQGKVATHSMRKTYANKVYRYFKNQLVEGKPVDPFHLTSKALGHRNINNTDKYLSFKI
jgi:integrase